MEEKLAELFDADEGLSLRRQAEDLLMGYQEAVASVCAIKPLDDVVKGLRLDYSPGQEKT